MNLPHLSLGLAASFLLLTACGDDTGGAGGGGTGGAGAGGDAAASLCDTVEPSTDTIAETQVAGEYPTPAGGTIAEGTYFLTSFEIYDPATADDHVRARRIDVIGDQVRVTNVDDGGAPEVQGGTLSTSGTELTLTITCPGAGSATVPYTATADELWLFDPSEPNVQKYARQ